MSGQIGRCTRRGDGDWLCARLVGGSEPSRRDPVPIASFFESPPVPPRLVVRIPVVFDMAHPAFHHVGHFSLCLRFGVARLTPLLRFLQNSSRISALTDQSTNPIEHLLVPAGGRLRGIIALGQLVQHGSAATCSDVTLAGQQLSQSPPLLQ